MESLMAKVIIELDTDDLTQDNLKAMASKLEARIPSMKGFRSQDVRGSGDMMMLMMNLLMAIMDIAMFKFSSAGEKPSTIEITASELEKVVASVTEEERSEERRKQIGKLLTGRQVV
jgi:hypothetical protein